MPFQTAPIVMERKNLIALLSKVFREHGYDGASLSIIVSHTGVGKGIENIVLDGVTGAGKTEEKWLGLFVQSGLVL